MQSHCPLRLLIGLVGLSLALLLVGMAQTDAPAPLPPAAQAAVNKGIIAAKVPDYLLAIRRFEDARKLAPDAPEVFYNLGLAESKIPGRELRAIAWFGAYLAANPTASNAVAVKEQMDLLVVRSQSNLSRFFKTGQDAANQWGPDDSQWDLMRAVKLQAQSGDIAGALKTAGLIQRTDYQSSAQSDIAQAKARSGDIADAQTTADLIQDEDAQEKNWAQLVIASAQAKSGDIAAAQKTLASAQKTADLIKDASVKSWMQSEIAEAQAEAADIAGAQKTTDLIKDAFYKSVAQLAIAKAQAKSGDIAAAQKTLASAQKTTDLIKDASTKSGKQDAIAEAQAEAMDIAGAQKTADLIKDAFYKSKAQRAIAEAQAKAHSNNAPNSTRQSPPATQPPIQSIITVSDWLGKLDDGSQYGDCPLNTRPFLDLAGYLKSLPQSDNPREVFKSLYETAEKIVKAQNVIHQMLKQQVAQQTKP